MFTTLDVELKKNGVMDLKFSNLEPDPTLKNDSHKNIKNFQKQNAPRNFIQDNGL